MHVLISIVALIIILGILIFVHELGHFTVAKFFGIRVDEFGMGLPPRAAKLFSRNGTDYTLNWIPFGGFVKIHGEDSLESNDPDFKRSLVAKAWWKQILVLVAGVAMNVILAWVLFSATLMAGAPVAASQVAHPELLRNQALTILEVSPKSPAEAAGLEAGDQIQKVSTSKEILTNATPQAFTQFVQSDTDDEPIVFTIKRGPTVSNISVTPATGIVPGHLGVGVSIDIIGIQAGLPFFQALGQGFGAMWNAIVTTWQSFAGLFRGTISLNSLSGPVGLTKVVGDAASVGFVQLVLLMAFISINLAVINILPFPALDGGRVLFIIIEKIIRRPLPKKFVEYANGIGFSLLILLMIVITVKDVIHLI